MVYRKEYGQTRILVIILYGMLIALLFLLKTFKSASSNMSGFPNSYSVVQEGSNLSGTIGIKAEWNLTSIIGSTANAYDAVTADVDGDGELEIIVSKDAQMQFFCLKQDGTILWETPILSTNSPGYYGGEIVDLTGNGRLEYIAVADGIWVLDALTGEVIWEVSNLGDKPEEVPWILGRITDKDKWDIILVRQANNRYIVSVYNDQGEFVWERDIGFAVYGHTITAQDIDTDGLDEIFVPISYKTIALSNTGDLLWARPLALGTNWRGHSDFAVVTELSHTGVYYLIHDAGGGQLNPVEIEIVNAHTGELVDSFVSYGHHQWLKAADFLPEYSGQELVYVTRDAVVMRNSSLEKVWEQPLSGAHELAVGDWNGDGHFDILVSTVFRGVERSANRDANFIVLNASGQIIYNMLYEYPPELDGHWGAAQMQTAMKAVADYDRDGRVDVPVSFSYHDVGKFGSSQAVYQYVMSANNLAYINEFHHTGNESTLQAVNTVLKDGSLQLGYQVPQEPTVMVDELTVLLLALDEGEDKAVYDTSPHNHHGLLTGGQWIPNAQFNAGLAFTNEGDVLTIPYTDTLDTTSITISLWLQADNLAQKRVILEKQGAFGLYLNEYHQLIWYFFDSSKEYLRRIEIKAPYLEQYGQFTHIVATYDGRMNRLYINGIQQASESHWGTIDFSESPLLIGNETTGSWPAHATFDDILISTDPFQWTFHDSGVWISKAIFPIHSFIKYGVFEFEHEAHGGQIFYDFLNEEGVPIPNYSHLTTSPVDLASLQGTVSLRIRLQKDLDSEGSPVVNLLSITRAVVETPPSEQKVVLGTLPFSYTKQFTLTSNAGDELYLAIEAPLNWSAEISPTKVFVPAQNSVMAVVTVYPSHFLFTTPQNITITVQSEMSNVPQLVIDQLVMGHILFLPVINSGVVSSGLKVRLTPSPPPSGEGLGWSESKLR